MSRPKKLTTQEERKISIPESEYRNLRRLKNRQTKTKKIVGQLTALYKDTR